MFVKKFFNWLSHLHSPGSQKYSYMYSMASKKIVVFLHMNIKNKQSFTLIPNQLK
jgi:hypothetical protein